MNLSEKETIILFNEQEPLAEIFTYNQRMKRELAQLAKTVLMKREKSKPTVRAVKRTHSPKSGSKSVLPAS